MAEPQQLKAIENKTIKTARTNISEKTRLAREYHTRKKASKKWWEREKTLCPKKPISLAEQNVTLQELGENFLTRPRTVDLIVDLSQPPSKKSKIAHPVATSKDPYSLTCVSSNMSLHNFKENWLMLLGKTITAVDKPEL